MKYNEHVSLSFYHDTRWKSEVVTSRSLGILGLGRLLRSQRLVEAGSFSKKLIGIWRGGWVEQPENLRMMVVSIS